MKRIKLTKEEQKIEDSIEEYVPASKAEFKRIAKMLANYRKHKRQKGVRPLPKAAL